MAADDCKSARVSSDPDKSLADLAAFDKRTAIEAVELPKDISATKREAFCTVEHKDWFDRFDAQICLDDRRFAPLIRLRDEIRRLAVSSGRRYLRTSRVLVDEQTERLKIKAAP